MRVSAHVRSNIRIMDACNHSTLHEHTFGYTNYITNGCTQPRIHKNKHARKISGTTENLDRINVIVL
jgi:hypothetical protein